MREKIVILSHSFHAFLLNEIEYASNIFELVIVLTEYNEQLKKKFNNYQNVYLEFFTKQELKMAAAKNIFQLFSVQTGKELFSVLCQNAFNYAYIRNLGSFFGFSYLAKKCVSKYEIQKLSTDYILLASWYFEDAYAVAVIKNKMKDVATVSLVHSYEIDRVKNPYIYVLYRNWYHKRLDMISFISKNMYKAFCQNIANKLKLDLDRTSVAYLGTKKQLSGHNPGNIDDELVIVLSCSYIIPVKRLDLLYKGLCLIRGKKVKWVHIGDGAGADCLKNDITNSGFNNIEVEFLGSKDNEFVHQYLRDTPIDVFINTSSSEGIPVTIMEALAYGIPVIATDVGGNSEIVDKTCGILLSSDPVPQEIADAVLELKNSTREEVLIKRKEAMLKFMKNFDSDKIRIEFYNRLKRL